MSQTPSIVHSTSDTFLVHNRVPLLILQLDKELQGLLLPASRTKIAASMPVDDEQEKRKQENGLSKQSGNKSGEDMCIEGRNSVAVDSNTFSIDVNVEEGGRGIGDDDDDDGSVSLYESFGESDDGEGIELDWDWGSHLADESVIREDEKSREGVDNDLRNNWESADVRLVAVLKKVSYTIFISLWGGDEGNGSGAESGRAIFAAQSSNTNAREARLGVEVWREEGVGRDLLQMMSILLKDKGHNMSERGVNIDINNDGNNENGVDHGVHDRDFHGQSAQESPLATGVWHCASLLVHHVHTAMEDIIPILEAVEKELLPCWEQNRASLTPSSTEPATLESCSSLPTDAYSLLSALSTTTSSGAKNNDGVACPSGAQQFIVSFVAQLLGSERTHGQSFASNVAVFIAKWVARCVLGPIRAVLEWSLRRCQGGDMQLGACQGEKIFERGSGDQSSFNIIIRISLIHTS